jgi:PAS domain S-box-containing protein
MANEAISKMFGYESPEQFMQSNVSDLYVDPAEMESFSKQLLAQGSVNAVLLRVKKKDGSPFWASATARAVYNDQGKIKYFDGIIEDITERKRLENKLRQAQKIESIGNLAGGVAHDFNNMLSIILGNMELIMEDLDKANPIFDNMQEIQKAAERSADLTRQLLAFARKQTIVPKLLDINESIEGILRMLRRLIGEDIDLAWLPKVDLWTVKVDPSQVDQVLTNLCVNARDSIKGVGKVTIETDNTNLDKEYCHDHLGFVPGDYVMISVSDNGFGMDKETLNNIFEPFFTTKAFGEGTGLGLSTVYGIVKQNNGLINVYSELGKGTTVKIHLPRYIEKVSQPHMQGLEEPAVIGDETILLVEDEKAILRMTTKMLESLGYTVLAASSPAEAIRVSESHPGEIDLLMTDVVMPEMSGPELAKSMLHLYPNLRCLFMSGYTANVIAHHKVLNEAVYFLNKPFSIQDLATKVREACDDAKSQSHQWLSNV